MGNALFLLLVSVKQRCFSLFLYLKKREGPLDISLDPYQKSLTRWVRYL